MARRVIRILSRQLVATSYPISCRSFSTSTSITRRTSSSCCIEKRRYREFSTGADDASKHNVLAVLRDETELVLGSSDMDGSRLISLMEDWSHQDEPMQSAQQTQKLLQHWLKDTTTPQTKRPFELSLKAWQRVGNGDEAISVLDEWGHLLEGNMTLCPTLQDFEAVMDAYAQTNDQDNFKKVEKLLLLLEQWHDAGVPWSQPRVQTFAHVIASLSHQPYNDTHKRKAMDLLTKMKSVYPQSTQDAEDVYFMVRSYSNMISWMADARETQTTQSMLANMNQLLDQTEISLEEVSTDFKRTMNGRRQQDSLEDLLGSAFQAVMQQVVASEMDNVMKADTINDLHDRLCRFSDWSTLPWTSHYEHTIQGWADRNQAERCEELLKQMEDRHVPLQKNDNNIPEYSKLSLKPYEKMLHMHSRLANGDEGRYLLFHAIAQKEILDAAHFEWTKCWNHALSAYAHEGRHDSVSRLWKEFKAASNLFPDAYTYSVVLKSLSMSSERHAARLAGSILKSMKSSRHPNAPQPTALHYGHVIVAWSRSSDPRAAMKAQQLLQEMEFEHSKNPKRGVEPTAIHYTAVISAWAKNKDREAALNNAKTLFTKMESAGGPMKPDYITYNAMLDVWSKQRSEQAAERAEELLLHMEHESKREGNEDWKPSRVSYTSVISAWAASRSVEAPMKAEALLQRLRNAFEASGEEALRPDSHVYAAVIGAWATSRHAHAGDRAEELLNQIMKSGEVTPNEVMMTNVIRAHFGSDQSDGPERAEAILELMHDLCYNQGYVEAKPDVVAYTSVIKAWARSPSPRKAQRAWNVLERMFVEFEKNGNVYARPNIITYTALLNACAFTRGSEADRNRALEIAQATMKKLYENNEKPNHLTFRTLFQVFGMQVQDKQEQLQLAIASFEECAREGQVDSSVVKTIQSYFPGLYDRFPRDGSGNVNLPAKWSSNVIKLSG